MTGRLYVSVYRIYSQIAEIIMALKKCKECGKEVSTKAKSCPNCGAQLKGGGCAASIARIILFLLALASVPLAWEFVGPIGLLGSLVLFLMALFLK